MKLSIPPVRWINITSICRASRIQDWTLLLYRNFLNQMTELEFIEAVLFI